MISSAHVDSPTTTGPTTAPPVYLFEEHDQAYHVWRRLGIKDKTLVHIDAHIDFDWFPDKNPSSLLEARSLSDLDELLKQIKIWNHSPDPKATSCNIGNYIYSAIQDGIVKKFFWVVPDDYLNSPQRISSIARLISKITKRLPGGKRARVLVNGKTISAAFNGVDIITCALDDLPGISDKVLLDIDVDFFTSDFDRVKDTALLQLKRRIPWIMPEGLVNVLRRKKISPCVSTIAYSVEKFFTPIEFKCLGDDLKMLLEDAAPPRRLLQASYRRTRAMASDLDGAPDEALAFIDEAISCASAQACNYFIRSRILWRLGLTERAIADYSKAVSLDGSYRSRYNNLGQIYASLGLADEALLEFKRFVALDGQNTYAHSGMAEAMLMKNDVDSAKAHLRTSLELDPGNTAALRLLADIFEYEKRYDDSLKLNGRIIEYAPADLASHLAWSRLFYKTGSLDRSIESALTAVRLGFYDTALCAQLGSCYLMKRRYLLALKEYFRAATSCPREAFIRAKNRFNAKRSLKTVLRKI